MQGQGTSTSIASCLIKYNCYLKQEIYVNPDSTVGNFLGVDGTLGCKKHGLFVLAKMKGKRGIYQSNPTFV